MPAQSFTPELFNTFGNLLKYLRRRQRLTQLELSITVGYSEGQISRLEQNQRLPDLTALKALFIPALHIENEPEITARFIELAQSARQEDAPTPGLAPYKGLLFFNESDSELFFGREKLTARLADRVTGLAMDAFTRFLAIVGASGSGKSSLIRAGLAVTLKHVGWDVRVFTPGANPFKALEMQFELNQAKVESKRVLLLVDQFEETFTLCHSETERVAFIEKLLELAQDTSRKTMIAIALRADFYSHCAQYPLLRQAVATEQEYIGQMTAEELRRAIEEPAKRGGWEFESGLVDVLLNDIGADGMGQPEPGALPLLSHALLATWERRRGHMFTLDGYRASGGVRSAIAETAESVFADQLNQKQQELAHDVFLRLTELGEGTEDTRRRASLNELVRQADEATQVRAVLNTLAEARLITLNEDSAEVAHEALIREWQRLHEWLTQDREGLHLHRHLTESTREWETMGREPSELYRGARLAQAREWVAVNEDHLNESERSFLKASIDQEEHDELEREAQRQRELEAAQRLAETKSQSELLLRGRNRVISVVGVVALLLAMLAGIFGLRSNQNATIAQKQSRIASASELAAVSIANLDIDPELSILLALQSANQTYALDRTVIPQAEDALHRAIQSSRIQLTLSGHTGEVWQAVFSPDGKRIATASQDGFIRIWNPDTGEEQLSWKADNLGRINSLAFSPNGKLLATGGEDQTVKVWDVQTRKEIMILKGHSSLVTHVAFSPDGMYLASTSWDGTAKIWDIDKGEEMFTLQVPDGNLGVYWVEFSPDGTRIVTGSSDGVGTGSASLWDVATHKLIYTFSENGVRVVVFSPDGKRLVTANGDFTAKLYDAETGKKLLTFYGDKNVLIAAAFSPDGTRLATTSRDRRVKIWDVATGEQLFTLAGHTGSVNSVVFSPDGTRVLTASEDKTAKVWNANLSQDFLTLVHGPALPSGLPAWLAYSPDGTRLATTGYDPKASVWDVKTGKVLFNLIGHSIDARAIAYSPNGKFIITGSDDKTARIWDAATGRELHTLTGHTDLIVGVAFSPDSNFAATASGDGSAKVWDVSTGKELLTLPAHKDWVGSVAFSPDGTRLATSSWDTTGKVWDLATGKELLTLTGHNGAVLQIVFSPDGKRLATASFDGTAKMWDSLTGKKLFTLTGHTSLVIDIVFNRDGTQLATASTDKTAKVWDAATGYELLTLEHPSRVFSVAFSPDGNYLATAGGDGINRIYVLRIEGLIALAKLRLTRTLTLEECQQYLHMDTCPDLP